MTDNRSTPDLERAARSPPIRSTRHGAAAMPLQDAHAELFDALIAQPREPDPAPAPPHLCSRAAFALARRPARGARGRRRLRGADGRRSR